MKRNTRTSVLLDRSKYAKDFQEYAKTHKMPKVKTPKEKKPFKKEDSEGPEETLPF